MLMYGISDIAFVGGSLVQHGGHNPLEPLAFKVPVNQAFTSAHVRLKKDGQLIAEQNLAAGQLTASFSGLDYYTPYKIETTLCREIGRASVGKECRSRWSPYH